MADVLNSPQLLRCHAPEAVRIWITSRARCGFDCLLLPIIDHLRYGSATSGCAWRRLGMISEDAILDFSSKIR